MHSTTFQYTDYAGIQIFVYKWEPEAAVSPKGVVQILHGMAEHAARYTYFAEKLTEAGYIVYADDHRGHGKSALDLDHAGQLGPDGWKGTLKSIRELSEQIKQNHPNLPLFLFGHSWGSYLGQNYIEEWGSDLKGVILSGTNGEQPMLNILIVVGSIIAAFAGKNSDGKILHNLAIKPLNKPFEPAESPNAWLSRDPNVAKAYDEDPLCGYMMPYSYFLELAKGLKNVWKAKNEAKIPKDLPIYMFTGAEDPTNLNGKGMEALFERYKQLGIQDLSKKSYEGARHETLNETNKDEVIQDTIKWLENHL